MAYCPDCDPILAAGRITCGACGAGSYPTAAEWVTGDLILAAYASVHAPGCQARREFGAVLLDLGQEDPDVPDVQRPRLCRATAVTTGRQCRAPARPGSGYCHRHGQAPAAAGGGAR